MYLSNRFIINVVLAWRCAGCFGIAIYYVSCQAWRLCRSNKHEKAARAKRSVCWIWNLHSEKGMFKRLYDMLSFFHSLHNQRGARVVFISVRLKITGTQPSNRIRIRLLFPTHDPKSRSLVFKTVPVSNSVSSDVQHVCFAVSLHWPRLLHKAFSALGLPCHAGEASRFLDVAELKKCTHRMGLLLAL